MKKCKDIFLLTGPSPRYYDGNVQHYQGHPQPLLGRSFFVSRFPGVPVTVRPGVALIGHGRTWAFLLVQSPKLSGGVL
ncbi:MAG: hypothetical protein A4E65_02446 [Syntrophorhabdus sp. PtaU1.Bin153]|nr:MAG: hypothetical protein A4E65_02446 [Syntrophorhabdus sp. PtaU1.Bin153]